MNLDYHNATPRERWVIQRLRRAGYRDFNPYCEHAMMLWKPLRPYWSFEWCDNFQFTLCRQRGCFIHFRPSIRPALHWRFHMAWPGVKNWGEIAEFEKFCEDARKVLTTESPCASLP